MFGVVVLAAEAFGGDDEPAPHEGGHSGVPALRASDTSKESDARGRSRGIVSLAEWLIFSDKRSDRSTRPTSSRRGRCRRSRSPCTSRWCASAIAFPVFVLAMEWLGRRRGDPLLIALAKRWSKAMIALFAIGVVTGTILSFELGLLWPEFMATYGDVFGLAFALEGFSFFVEAIFIALYVYGWDRLSPRAHMLTGIPVIVAGFTGSLFVLVGERLDEPPDGLPDGERRGGRRPAVRGAVRQLLLLARDDPHVPRGLPRRRVRHGERLRGRVAARAARPVREGGDGGAAGGRRAGRADPGRGRRLGRARGGEGAADEARRVRGAGGDGEGRVLPHRRLVLRADNDIEYGIPVPKMLSLLAFHDPNATVQGLDAVPVEDRPPVNVVRVAFFTMVGIGTLLAAFGAWLVLFRWRRGRLPDGPWFHRAVAALGPLSVVALLSGWVTTEVGRQPWVVYGLHAHRAGGDEARSLPSACGGHPRRSTARSLPPNWGLSLGCCGWACSRSANRWLGKTPSRAAKLDEAGALAILNPEHSLQLAPISRN